jgi:hypothetical protein
MELEDDQVIVEFLRLDTSARTADWNNMVVTSCVSLDSPSQASMLDNAERESLRKYKCEVK